MKCSFECHYSESCSMFELFSCGLTVMLIWHITFASENQYSKIIDMWTLAGKKVQKLSLGCVLHLSVHISTSEVDIGIKSEHISA